MEVHVASYKRNLQLPKIRLEKHNLSSLGVFLSWTFYMLFFEGPQVSYVRAEYIRDK